MGDREIAIRAEAVPEVAQHFDLARADGLAALEQAETVVRYMASKCSGANFISHIQGRKYPLVTWWTTVGAALGLFPQEVSSTKLDTPDMTYLAVVEVRHGDQTVSRASAICSQAETTWKHRDEYAVKSMATTRATGKAYRLAFSFLAVMAGLEPTPAEEMPSPESANGKAPEDRAEQPAQPRTGYGKPWASKYEGDCQACGQPIGVGHSVHYHYLEDGTKRIEHEKCQGDAT